AELRGGSFGRRAGAVQAGIEKDGFAAYITADGLKDNGWRDSSPSELRRLYADLGWRGEKTEFHVTFTGAKNAFGNVGPTPIELLARRWQNVYTTPQNTQNQLAFVTANGTWRPTDTLTVQGNAYYRRFRQSHNDGNLSDAQPCDPALFPGFLCFGDNATQLFSINGQPVPDILNGALAGQIDRTSTQTNSFGGSDRTDTLTVQGNAYYRRFRQSHNDGNLSDAQPCDPALFPGFLCFGDNATQLFSINGQPVPDILNGALAGQIDRTSTQTNSFGG